MSYHGSSVLKLVVNGFGRIGKFTFGYLVARKLSDENVVNIGRRAGSSRVGITHCTERDPTPQEQYTVERLGEYRVIKLIFSFLGFKFEIERQPSVKEIHKMG